MDPFFSLSSPIELQGSMVHFPVSAPTDVDSSNSSPFSMPHSQSVKLLDELSSLHDFDFGQLFFNARENAIQPQRQDFASPWKSHILRSQSDSPSPQSSQYSSQTCSPWETCPGLAPATPDFPFQDIQADTFPHDASFLSIERPSTPRLESLSLYSPMASALLMPPNHDPLSLEILPESLLLFSDDVPDKTIMHDHNAAPTNTNDNEQHTWDQSRTSPDITEFNLVGSPPSPSEGSDSPLSALSSPSPSMAVSSKALASRSPASQVQYDVGQSPSEPFTFSKVSKRKIVKINYAEDGYDGDSDEEYAGSRRSVSSKRSRQASEDFSPDEGAPSRSGTPPTITSGRRAKSKFPANGSNQRNKKSKKRHWCTRDGCQTSFTRPTDLERHTASVHRDGGSDANKCSYCMKAFSREDAVLRHENDSCPARPKKKADIWK